MSIAIGLWSVELTPGKEEVVVPQADLRITNAALSDQVTDSNGRTTVKFSYVTPMQVDSDDEDEEEDVEVPPTYTTVLCSLTPGKIEQATTDIVLEQDEEYTFTVVGKNAVFLTGNYIDQVGADRPPYDEDDSDMDSEDDYDLREVSSDVEMHGDEFDDLESDASRFEEVNDEEPVKAQKRPRDSDDTESAKPTKAEKKNKKLKAEGGKAVPAEVSEKEEKKEGKKDKKTDKAEKKTEKKETDSGKEQELAGGVKIKDAKIGTGPMAKKGNTVSMRYIGKLQNGKVFDSNTKGKPFTFHLGKGEVIKGWDIGIVGMQAGGERKLTIPSNMAYGKRGAGADIPPNATLTFEVKLMEIK